MCGIIGIVGHPNSHSASMIYDGMLVLQHRGQDAAGIVTSDSENITHRRANGLVRDVFTEKHMQKLTGSMGIGHVRYPTAGSNSADEAQPFYTNTPFGVSIAHNGNLNNNDDIINGLLEYDHRRVNTSSDSEALLNLFAAEIQRSLNGRPGGMDSLLEDDIFRAIERLHLRVEGSYSVTALITGWGLIGFRDPHGIRPLFMGKNKLEDFTEVIIASESVACTALGFTPDRDIEPGEAVIVRIDGKISSKICHPEIVHRPCIFEHVYFARPDSVIDGISVHDARLRMGELLAKRISAEYPNHEIEAVIPVPDSGRIAALDLAKYLGVPYREGFVKNRYIGRTFIMPEQDMRRRSVRRKLNPINDEFKDKNVLLVDDSIVRGTTMKEIVAMCYKAGAKKVSVASSSSEVKFPNVYGIDMPAKSELIASNRSVEEVKEFIGCDNLIYQDLSDLVDSVTELNSELNDVEKSIFTGTYPTNISDEYLEDLEKKRQAINS